MKKRAIEISLAEAKRLYKSKSSQAKRIALKAFTKEELEAFDFTEIKSFEDACKALGLNHDIESIVIKDIARVSKATAAMFQVNIIRKALNLGYDLSLTEDPKNSCIYYPYNPFVTESSNYYKEQLNKGIVKVIGKIENTGVLYNVLGGDFCDSSLVGLGNFDSVTGIGYASFTVGLLGCATRKIAEYFSEYFGMLITEANYGDIVDFKILK